MGEFRVTVRTSSGLPIANAAVRVLSATNEDKTAILFGSSPVYTDASGIFRHLTPFLNRGLTLPIGVYTITGSAPGYSPASADTGVLFLGVGLFELTLETVAPAPEDIDITLPDARFVSPMYPVEVVVQAVAPSAKWEYIEATVTSSQGSESIIEVQTVNGEARINLQARLELETSLYLVGDTVAAAIDPDFSDEFTITLASLTPSGRVPISDEFTMLAANAFPTGETNDLSNFTNADGLAAWLTPWAELPKFRGHVADAMIWLPVTEGGDQYALQVNFQNINRSPISSLSIALEAALFSSQKVVRVRIPEAVAGAAYATLVINKLGQAQTKPLIVRYING